MKREVTLSYSQLRQILCLTISNKTLKAKLEDFLSGKLTKVSEVELLELISESEADKELIRIISKQDPDTMDALMHWSISPLFSSISEPTKTGSKVGSGVSD